MSTALLKRLEKLEMKQPSFGRVHRLYSHSKKQQREQEAALKASPEWSEGDMLMSILFVGAKDGEPVVHPDDMEDQEREPVPVSGDA